jgi:puromycin-sensitive aminopeptidase
MPDDAHRLPGTVRPRHYELSIDVDPERDTFEGRAEIWISSDDPARELRLDARDLDVHEVVLEQGNTRYRGKARLDEEAEQVVLEFPETVPAGQGRLLLGYRGQISEGMSGLYLSESGDERCLVTQCEATDARAVFPCFDEPCYKAPIQWTITAPDDLTVLANGALDERRDDGDGRATWTFKATPPIPSYLAALAVGDFDATPEARRDDVPFRVWALGDKAELGTHARDTAVRLLPWFETYFDVEYPFKKYDQVAVPSFSFGAMENVGLVVFRDSLLLMDEDTASWSDVKAIDRVVAHEFAHMWFGNLVTMEWWDDLWLNEAFAEWIAHKAIDELEPTHDAWHDFEARTASALDTDALEATHPIYHPVETPEQAMEMFDAITYGKGSAVMRMLEAYLGEQDFRQGLRTYMEAFQQDNATGEDLWTHLEDAADEPVTDIMRAWITQPGHPVLDVDLDGETLVVEQRRAAASPAVQPDDDTWPVPLVARAGDAGTHVTRRALIEDDTTTVELDADGPVDWVFPNADARGFYRTRLSPALFEAALEHVNQLDPVERVRWLGDEWANVKAGDRSSERYVELLDTLAEVAEHHAVVEAVADRVRGLETLLEAHGSDEALDALRTWTRDRLAELPDPIEPGDDAEPSEGTRRTSLLKAAAAVGQDEDAIDTALELAEREREDPASVDPDLAGTAVALAARFGDEETYEEHARLYEERRDEGRPPQEVDRYLHSLPVFRGKGAVEATLERLEDGTVPKQDVGPLLATMLASPHAQDAAWDHVTDNVDTLATRIGPAWITRLVEASSRLDPARRDEVVAFWNGNLDGLAQEALGRAEERLEHSAHLVDEVLPEVEDAIEQAATR